jgi:hypothetical protein
MGNDALQDQIKANQKDPIRSNKIVISEPVEEVLGNNALQMLLAMADEGLQSSPLGPFNEKILGPLAIKGGVEGLAESNQYFQRDGYDSKGPGEKPGDNLSYGLESAFGLCGGMASFGNPLAGAICGTMAGGMHVGTKLDNAAHRDKNAPNRGEEWMDLYTDVAGESDNGARNKKWGEENLPDNIGGTYLKTLLEMKGDHDDFMNNIHGTGVGTAGDVVDIAQHLIEESQITNIDSTFGDDPYDYYDTF